jgi:hypothetical protein
MNLSITTHNAIGKKFNSDEDKKTALNKTEAVVFITHYDRGTSSIPMWISLSLISPSLSSFRSSTGRITASDSFLQQGHMIQFLIFSPRPRTENGGRQ